MANKWPKKSGSLIQGNMSKSVSNKFIQRDLYHPNHRSDANNIIFQDMKTDQESNFLAKFISVF